MRRHVLLRPAYGPHGGRRSNPLHASRPIAEVRVCQGVESRPVGGHGFASGNLRSQLRGGRPQTLGRLGPYWVACQFGARSDVELAVDVAEVKLDCLGAEEELGSGFAGGGTVGDH
jgi:hypothetical protein